MVEQLTSNSDLRAREILGRSSQIILSEEFAGRVNAIPGSMPDSTSLITLFGGLNTMVEHYADKRGVKYSFLPKDWDEFMKTLSRQERTQLSRLAGAGCGFFDMDTLGDIREFSSDVGYWSLRIGLRGKAFVHLAFKRDENV